MGGCDKTTPALLMGALSTDLPAIFVPAGPMLPATWRTRELAAPASMSGSIGPRARRQSAPTTIGGEIENAIARSPGRCMTMGTASTMTALPKPWASRCRGQSSIPAAVSAPLRGWPPDGAAGIVDMVWEDFKPSAFRDRRRSTMRSRPSLVGGSTNAIVHMIAVARRAGVPLTLDRFDELAQRTPLVANMRPAGKFLMEDFFYAGGLCAALSSRRLGLLDLTALHGQRQNIGRRTSRGGSVQRAT